MTTAEELAAFFEANGLGDRGVTIFRNFIPDTPSDVLVLIEEVGLPGAQYVHDAGGIITVEMPRITVISRSLEPDTGRELIEQAFILSGTITNTVIVSGGVFWWRCAPMTSPYLEGRDYNGWFRFAVRLQITKLPSSG